MKKYKVTKIEEKKVGQITLPNGVFLLSESNNRISESSNRIVVALNCHVNPAYININNIMHNLIVTLDECNPRTDNYEVPSVITDKELRIESRPCKNNLNTTWAFYYTVETYKEVEDEMLQQLIDQVIL